jgi:hypothetical protein
MRKKYELFSVRRRRLNETAIFQGTLAMRNTRKTNVVFEIIFVFKKGVQVLA